MEQTVKVLKDGIASNVKVKADSWEDAYDQVVTKTLESIAKQEFYHEKVVIFSEDGSIAREFAPIFESTGIIED